MVYEQESIIEEEKVEVLDYSSEQILSAGVGESKKISGEGVIKDLEVKKVGTKGLQILHVKVDFEGKEYSISRAKLESYDKVKERALWVQIDEKGRLRPQSAPHLFMNYFGVEKLGELRGKKCQVASGEDGFPLIKAY